MQLTYTIIPNGSRWCHVPYKLLIAVNTFPITFMIIAMQEYIRGRERECGTAQYVRGNAVFEVICSSITH